MNRLSGTIPVPNPTPVLVFTAAVLAWIFTADDKGLFAGAFVVLVSAILAATIVLVLSRHLLLGVGLVIASAVVTRFSVDVSGLRVRPEYIAIAMFVPTLPLWAWRRSPKPKWARADFFVLLYIAANLLSSAVMSISPRRTLVWATQQAIVTLPFFLLRVFATDGRRFRKAFNLLLIVGTVQAGIGVLCFFSNLAFGTEFGIEPNQYGTMPGTYGLAYEANILGALSACTFVMLLATYIYERRRILLLGVAISYAGLLIALARAALGATVIVVTGIAIVGFREKLLDRIVLKRIGATLLIATAALLPAVTSLYVERFSTVEVSDITADPDTLVRVVVLVRAVDGIIAHPLLGNGTASFQLLSTNEELGVGGEDQGAWIANVQMRILHDTGIVGFFLFVFFAVALGWRALRILKQQRRPELAALMVGCAIYAITFQATEGTLMAFFWVQLGLFATAISLNEEPSPGSMRYPAFNPQPGSATI